MGNDHKDLLTLYHMNNDHNALLILYPMGNDQKGYSFCILCVMTTKITYFVLYGQWLQGLLMLYHMGNGHKGLLISYHMGNGHKGYSFCTIFAIVTGCCLFCTILANNTRFPHYVPYGQRPQGITHSVPYER